MPRATATKRGDDMQCSPALAHARDGVVAIGAREADRLHRPFTHPKRCRNGMRSG